MKNEREIIVNRFFRRDIVLYNLGIFLKIKWFDKFKPIFAKDKNAAFSPEVREEAYKKISTIKCDDKFFINALKSVEKSYFNIDIFVGSRYSFDIKS